MSQPKQKTDYALLGVLAQGGPMSGYDARAYIALSIAQFWNESFGQIYPALARLQKLGLVKSRSDRGSKRERRIYEITAAGRKALAGWLEQPPEPERPRSEVLLKTMFGALASSGAIVSHLRAELERAEVAATRLEAQAESVRRTDADSDSLPYAIAVIRAGVHLSRARAAWAREAIALIETTDPRRTNR